MLTREQMAQRVAQELRDGYYVNLGIGIPTLVANYVPAGMDVMLQSENGLLGMGEFPTEQQLDADMINAGKQTGRRRGNDEENRAAYRRAGRVPRHRVFPTGVGRERTGDARRLPESQRAKKRQGGRGDYSLRR